jgi:branched-chain amino acid transport system permease protein
LRNNPAQWAAAQKTTEGRAVLLAFVISTALAGLAGSLFAHFEAFISPFDFNLEMSLFILALAVCGGLGSVTGTILGTVFLGGLVELVEALTIYRLLISGGVFLLVGLWFPQGLLTVFRVWKYKPRLTFRMQSSDQSLLVD